MNWGDSGDASDCSVLIRLSTATLPPLTGVDTGTLREGTEVVIAVGMGRVGWGLVQVLSVVLALIKPCPVCRRLEAAQDDEEPAAPSSWTSEGRLPPALVLETSPTPRSSALLALLALLVSDVDRSVSAGRPCPVRCADVVEGVVKAKGSEAFACCGVAAASVCSLAQTADDADDVQTEEVARSTVRLG